MTTASLYTGRLDLALPTAEDAEAIFTIAGDPATVGHNPSDLLAHVAEAHELVSQWIQHWQDRGLRYCCVREAGQSRVVGYCGVKAMSAHGQPVLNLIYRFTPDVWGRGYATEAAIAAVAWAGQHQPDVTILVRVRPARPPRTRLSRRGCCVTGRWTSRARTVWIARSPTAWAPSSGCVWSSPLMSSCPTRHP